MKVLKKLLITVCAFIAVMLVNIVPAYSMDFDAETIYESVFVIHSGNSLGSGFAIGENCIVTNAHVIEKSSNIKIETYGGSFLDAFIVTADENRDIAILCAKDGLFKPLKVADLSSVKIGDDVFAIGAPNSLSYTLTKGVISAKDRKVGRYTYIQADAAINSGNSGGPLLNAAGEIIGVNTYKMSNSEGIGLSIPIDAVTEILKANVIEPDSSGSAFRIDAQQNQAEQNQEGETMEAGSAANVAGGVEPSERITPLYIILAISVILNIILIIMLTYQKQKNVYPKINPSERTDFDIDILE